MADVAWLRGLLERHRVDRVRLDANDFGLLESDKRIDKDEWYTANSTLELADALVKSAPELLDALALKDAVDAEAGNYCGETFEEVMRRVRAKLEPTKGAT